MTTLTIWNRNGKQTQPPEPGTTVAYKPPPVIRRPAVYGALVVFSWLYYYRPEDFIPGLSHIPMAKIAGIIGIIALAVAMMGGGGKVKVPRAVVFLWLLLFQMIMCVPTSLWKGGAISTIVDKYSKAVVVAMLISMSVFVLKELRKLLWIQVSAVALVVAASIATRHMRDGRLEGVQKSILENPNDLAINIAINFPLAMAFMLNAKGFKKVIWIAGMAAMALGVVLTYSRSGLLAFIISVLVCVYEYGIKGNRRYLIGLAVGIFVAGLIVVASSSSYRARVESIVLGNIEGSHDKGSLDARKELLKKSLIVALHHPIFGVGPGCFIIVDQGWIVAHNSYTELTAECGFPGLALFLLAMFTAFRNVATVKGSLRYETDPEFQLFTQALWAGLAAYIFGAAFDSTEYNLYPYYLIGYTCAMIRIAGPQRATGEAKPKKQSLTRLNYGTLPRTQSSWNR